MGEGRLQPRRASGVGSRTRPERAARPVTPPLGPAFHPRIPGTNTRFTVTYDPTVPGSWATAVRIDTNAPATPTFELLVPS